MKTLIKLSIIISLLGISGQSKAQMCCDPLGYNPQAFGSQNAFQPVPMQTFQRPVQVQIIHSGYAGGLQ